MHTYLLIHRTRQLLHPLLQRHICRAHKAQALKVCKHVLQRPVVGNVPVRQQQDVVKQRHRLWGWLQQRHLHSVYWQCKQRQQPGDCTRTMMVRSKWMRFFRRAMIAKVVAESRPVLISSAISTCTVPTIISPVCGDVQGHQLHKPCTYPG